jgi:uncharacterized protein (DUF1919 family)
LALSEALAQWLLRRQLKNKNFTIIANNCFGGFVYQQLGLPYQTPMAGLFFYAPCYIRMLLDLKGYLNATVTFIGKSRYPEANHHRLTQRAYPIGLLKDDVEIHFLHYETPAIAKSIWNRRVKRINWDNLFFKFCDRERCNANHLEAFDRLPYRHKVCFTATAQPHLKSNVWIEACKGQPCINDTIALTLTSSLYTRHFDLAGWLNGDQEHALMGPQPNGISLLVQHLSRLCRH